MTDIDTKAEAMSKFRISMPPEPNWRIKLPIPDTYWVFYSETPPSWFQRKMWEVVLGCKWQRIEQKRTNP